NTQVPPAGRDLEREVQNPETRPCSAGGTHSALAMTRYDLLLLLDRYLVRYPDEEEMVARVRALVEAHADCACRSCRPGHLTGSAWIVSPDRQRVALVHHRKLERWLQPGGHADGDTDIAAVAWREATEETGLGRLRLL